MIIGIDLGTTNSAVSIWRDGKSELIPNAMGDFLTPSAVSVSDDGAVMVGIAARERQAAHPRQTATTFKRLMGTAQKIKLGRTEFTPEDLSSLVLRSLKSDVETATGEEVTGAVITVPAYFNDRQRKATRRAGELAGLRVDRLVNEPTAAALAFGIQDREPKEPFLVFDLGGGTFDVSIVEMFDGIVEVRASSGDNRLGGEDFNQCLISLARPIIDPEGRLAKSDQVVLEELLRVAAERAKRALSEGDAATFTIMVGDESYATEISGSAFEEQAAGLLTRLREPVLRSLRDSRIRVDQLSEIVLVGGATRMPLLRRAITKMFGRFPNATVHPDHAVALGAGVQAGLLASDSALDEIRLTDVCPFTLGVETTERDQRGNYRYGLFSPIIDRNTAIPVSRVGYYNTLIDNQREIVFEIYQGEARLVADNVHLGKIRITVPAKPAGQVSVECRFTYDTSGLLEVDLLETSSGTTRNLVIADADDKTTEADLEKRRAALAKLKFHPREDHQNVAALARAARCYESYSGDQRAHIGGWITTFEGALESQDPRQIQEAREAMIALLDALDGEQYL
jgi:molecular chaperone HscC